MKVTILAQDLPIAQFNLLMQGRIMEMMGFWASLISQADEVDLIDSAGTRMIIKERNTGFSYIPEFTVMVRYLTAQVDQVLEQLKDGYYQAYWPSSKWTMSQWIAALYGRLTAVDCMHESMCAVLGSTARDSIPGFQSLFRKCEDANKQLQALREQEGME